MQPRSDASWKPASRTRSPYISYDIPRPRIARRRGSKPATGTASHSPVLDEEGDVAFIIQNTVDVTDLVRLREAASLPFSVRSGAVELIEHAREVEQAHRELLAESDDFRRLFQPGARFLRHPLGNRSRLHLRQRCLFETGRAARHSSALPVREALPEIEGQGFLELLDEVHTQGRERGATGAPVLLQRDLGLALEQRYVDFFLRAHPRS